LIDHVAITVEDLDASFCFYDRLFRAKIHAEYAPDGKLLVRQIALGDIVLSIHQINNGVDLVAKRPTTGSADLCFRWGGTMDSAINLLKENNIEIIHGPVPRTTSSHQPAQSIFFRDPDGNLLELMAADQNGSD
ncbi:VOC family protein, partial [Raoultella planticola]